AEKSNKTAFVWNNINSNTAKRQPKRSKVNLGSVSIFQCSRYKTTASFSRGDADPRNSYNTFGDRSPASSNICRRCRN
ncbi:hypothetical protein EC991_011025, partial [Linnemannia zychae]